MQTGQGPCFHVYMFSLLVPDRILSQHLMEFDANKMAQCECMRLTVLCMHDRWVHWKHLDSVTGKIVVPGTLDIS